jgi:hypothetical protein
MKIQIFIVLIVVLLISSQSTQSSTSSSSSTTTGGNTQTDNSNTGENQVSGGGWFGNLFSSGEKETDSYFTPTSSVETSYDLDNNDDYDEFFSSEADKYFQ